MGGLGEVAGCVGQSGRGRLTGWRAAVAALSLACGSLHRRDRRPWKSLALRSWKRYHSSDRPSAVSTISGTSGSELNQRIYGRIEEWRNAPIVGEHPYVFLDGLWLKRSWGGEVKNVSVLVAIGVNQDGFRDVLGVAEGTKEDAESWRSFLRYLKERGLKGVRLIVSDKCLGLVDASGEFFPEAAWQRCVVHFYRNVMSAVPTDKVKEVMAAVKAIHAQEDQAAAAGKAELVARKLEGMRLGKAARLVYEFVHETLAYYAFPREHWRSLRTNNPLERLNREIRRRTRVVGAFPDGQSALMLVSARLRHMTTTHWGLRRYLNMKLLWAQDAERAMARDACLMGPLLV